MRIPKTVAVSLSAIMVLVGCAETPMGPGIQVLPAADKPFEVFQQDDANCRHYATDQVGDEAVHANEKAIGMTLLGGALGAGLGAALGGGRGAAIGAAGGGIAGTAVGANGSERTQQGIQRQYDNAYAQCMYAKGNQVAPPPVRTVIRPMVVYPAPAAVYVPPPAVYYPPPAAVYTPPPPPPMGYKPPPPPPLPANGQ